jgi:ABC-type bacteriocin/lantibiotic exporter with double-glycine peptidase domain
MNIFSYINVLLDYTQYIDNKKKLLKSIILFGTSAAFFEVAFPAFLGIGAGILFNDSSGTDFLAYLNFFEKNGINALIVFSIFLIIFSLVRYFFIILFFKKKYSFAMQYGYSIAEKTEHSILKLDLFSRRKSLNPDLSRIIHSETNTITWKFFVPMVDLFHELIVIIISILALALISFDLFLLCLPIIILSFIYFIFSSNKNEKIQDDDVNFRERLAIYAEIIHEGALDTVSQSNKNWLKNKITDEFKNIKNTQKINILNALMPRPRIETMILLLFGVLIIVLYFFKINLYSSYLVGVLIFLRMLMSIGKFYGSVLALRLGSTNAKNVLKNLQPALNYNTLESNENNQDESNGFIFNNKNKHDNQFSIELKNLTVGWNQNQKIAVENIKVNKGELLLVKGQSGAGKSTLLRTISNSLYPTSGNLIFTNFSKSNCEKEIFYIRQDPHIIPSSLIENLILDDVDNYLDINDISKDVLHDKAKNLLVNYGFTPERISSLLKLNNINKLISGGEAQRIAILRLFFSKNVKLCLFDEPTASLDKKNITLISNLINEVSEKKICIIITHDDYFAKLLESPSSKSITLKN